MFVWMEICFIYVFLSLDKHNGYSRTCLTSDTYQQKPLISHDVTKLHLSSVELLRLGTHKSSSSSTIKAQPALKKVAQIVPLMHKPKPDGVTWRRSTTERNNGHNSHVHVHSAVGLRSSADGNVLASSAFRRMEHSSTNTPVLPPLRHEPKEYGEGRLGVIRPCSHVSSSHHVTDRTRDVSGENKNNFASDGPSRAWLARLMAVASQESSDADQCLVANATCYNHIMNASENHFSDFDPHSDVRSPRDQHDAVPLEESRPRTETISAASVGTPTDSREHLREWNGLPNVANDTAEGSLFKRSAKLNRDGNRNGCTRRKSLPDQQHKISEVLDSIENLTEGLDSVVGESLTGSHCASNHGVRGCSHSNMTQAAKQNHTGSFVRLNAIREKQNGSMLKLYATEQSQPGSPDVPDLAEQTQARPSTGRGVIKQVQMGSSALSTAVTDERLRSKEGKCTSGRLSSSHITNTTGQCSRIQNNRQPHPARIKIQGIKHSSSNTDGANDVSTNGSSFRHLQHDVIQTKAFGTSEDVPAILHSSDKMSQRMGHHHGRISKTNPDDLSYKEKVTTESLLLDTGCKKCKTMKRERKNLFCLDPEMSASSDSSINIITDDSSEDSSGWSPGLQQRIPNSRLEKQHEKFIAARCPERTERQTELREQLQGKIEGNKHRISYSIKEEKCNINDYERLAVKVGLSHHDISGRFKGEGHQVRRNKRQPSSESQQLKKRNRIEDETLKMSNIKCEGKQSASSSSSSLVQAEKLKMGKQEIMPYNKYPPNKRHDACRSSHKSSRSSEAFEVGMGKRTGSRIRNVASPENRTKQKSKSRNGTQDRRERTEKVND